MERALRGGLERREENILLEAKRAGERLEDVAVVGERSEMIKNSKPPLSVIFRILWWYYSRQGRFIY